MKTLKSTIATFLADSAWFATGAKAKSLATVIGDMLSLRRATAATYKLLEDAAAEMKRLMLLEGELFADLAGIKQAITPGSYAMDVGLLMCRDNKDLEWFYDYLTVQANDIERQLQLTQLNIKTKKITLAEGCRVYVELKRKMAAMLDELREVNGK
jgi:hypothetical protein